MNLDIYYNLEYAKLYEDKDSKIEVFDFTSNNGKIKNIFLKRKIDIKIDDEIYYDICTPYGYGGPIIIEAADREKLVEEYKEKFDTYCKKNNIISEFIRFHPILNNALDFKNIYDIVFSRKVVATNLKDYEDPIKEEFSKSAKREIKKAKKEEINYSIIENPNSFENFIKLYYETMERNKATENYYFSLEYFNKILNNLSKEVLVIELKYLEKVIASELYFIQGDIMTAHLLGSSEEMLNLNIGGYLEALAVEWGKKNKKDFLYHGGGRTSEIDDSLFRYKKKFGQNTEFDFYIGKKIYNLSIYNKLVSIKKKENSKSIYFPLYREV